MLRAIENWMKQLITRKDSGLMVAGVICAFLFAVVFIVSTINENKLEESRLSSLAVELGFLSVNEMKELQAKGFNKKIDYENSEARKLGFDSAAEKKEIDSKGLFSSKQEYLDALESARQAGWDSYSEKIEASRKGIDNPRQYRALLAEEEKKQQKAQQEEERAKNKEAYCYMYKQALDACATAFDTNKCLNIKLYGDVYKYQSACR